MEEFATQNVSWRRRFLELPNGSPSHDTVSDVMGREESFCRWVYMSGSGCTDEPVGRAD